jgi:HEAT repeat protein
MHKYTKRLMLAVALWGIAVLPAVAQEAQLLAVLKSDAGGFEKATACRELSRVATKQSVPVLATLLGDEKLSHMARYALETINDPSVDEALRGALGKVSGRPLQGVIGSLGVRRDAKAVPAIAKLLTAADAGVAQAAARGLGQIGTADAAQALQAALAGAAAAQRLALAEGLFRCAESLAAQGQTAKSQAIYDHLRGMAQAPQQIRVAALRGAILTRGKAGVPLLVAAIRGADYVQTAAAARTAIELAGAEVTTALCGELPNLPADKQVLVINTLGYRGDAAAGPALLAVATKSSGAVRLAAVENLTHLAYEPVLPLLAKLALSGEADQVESARNCLGNFPSKKADAAILAMLVHKDAKVRSLAVELIGQRSIAGSTASLLKAAEDADEQVRITAIRNLRDQANVAQLPAMLQILRKSRSAAECQAAENAVAVLCARQVTLAGGNVVILKAEYGDLPAGSSADVTAKVKALVKDGALAVEASNSHFGDPASRRVKRLRIDYSVNGVNLSKTVREGENLIFTATATPPAIVEALCGAIQGAKGEPKLALLRTLRSAGGPKALQTVQAALADADPAVKNTAVRTLCDWPTPDALPIVTGLIQQGPTKTIKILALRGYVRLVPQDTVPEAAKFAALQNAMTLAERNEEKQLVISALGNVHTVESLGLVAKYLDTPALKEEACLAAVTIAERLGAGHEVQITPVMKQVAKQTANKKLAARAGSLAKGDKK